MLNIPMNFSRIFSPLTSWNHWQLATRSCWPGDAMYTASPYTGQVTFARLGGCWRRDIYIYMIWIIYLLKIVIVHSYVSLPAAYHHSDSENRPIQTGKSYLSTPDSWQGGFLAAQDITQLFINSYWLCNNRRNMYRTHVFVCICSIWIIGVLIKSTLNPH